MVIALLGHNGVLLGRSMVFQFNAAYTFLQFTVSFTFLKFTALLTSWMRVKIFIEDLFFVTLFPRLQ